VLNVDSAWQGARALLDGMGSPGAIALALALTTLLLEDLAIAAGVALATQGVISCALPVPRPIEPAAKSCGVCPPRCCWRA
jgi:hypothetical protein